MKLSTIVAIAAGVVGTVAGIIYLNVNKDEDTTTTTEATEVEVETEPTGDPVEA